MFIYKSLIFIIIYDFNCIYFLQLAYILHSKAFLGKYS